MRSILLLIAIVLFCFAEAAAQAPSAATFRESELGKHAFEIGQLRLTIRKLQGGRGPYITVKVENPSDSAVVFDPQVLSLVNQGNEQVNTSSYSLYYIAPALPTRKVLPGAFLTQTYGLDHIVELPARIYYDGKLLAIITE